MKNRPPYSKYYYVASPITVILAWLSGFTLGLWFWEFQLRGSFYFAVCGTLLFIYFAMFMNSDEQEVRKK